MSVRHGGPRGGRRGPGTTRWLAGILFVVAAAGLPVEAAGPTLTLVDATARMPTGATQGEARLMVKAEGLGEREMAADLQPKDLGGAVATSTTVDVERAVEVDRGTASRTWLLTMRVKGFPARSSERRYVRLTLGTAEQLTSYTLTDLPTEGFTWSVTAPASPWLVWRGLLEERTVTGLVVTAGDGPITGLRLAGASLRDAVPTSEIGVRDLTLCDAPSGDCRVAAIEPRSSRTLFLRLTRDRALHGKYTGALSLAINERPELQTLNLVVHASSLTAWGLGLVLLSLGTWLSWSTLVWSRARLLRLEALRPVTALRSSMAALLTLARSAPAGSGLEPRRTIARLLELDGALEEQNLDNGHLLPPEWPSPFSTAADQSAALRERLASTAQAIARLTIVVRDGVQALWAQWTRVDPNDPQAPARKQAIAQALDQLDEQCVQATDEDGARAAVAAALAACRKAMGIERDAAPETAAPLATEFLSWQIGRLHRRVWLVWGMLNVLAGAAVLILQNAGFGSPLDHLFCLFWGFGLPTAVDRLQQIGPSTMASQLGIMLPKVTP